jgi:hypothetical protein
MSASWLVITDEWRGIGGTSSCRFAPPIHSLRHSTTRRERRFSRL